ncbi:MaoC family dehydratase N-terminal domain-containing protein [Acidiphilium sp.]|uniref:FAS1-like dehydratase domain-containing protein n=1 Tax=Acidiphilium sp. TaxID=527 RepID=UPI00239FDD79|nr:MaoC family dehydratase N-terminal domain-containing protein [Acidiphilium sp.]MBU6357027.1 MaoC family dehydratase N-terminal domain-containing protein [Rhodospirillales bacterium]MDE2327414.1 MaoC family dehydratase N-terminal domain-containing protein [Rhodospirillales bacterium]
MTMTLDIDHLKSWIGRTETARDVVAPRLVREFAATFDRDDPAPRAGDPAPLAIHWCLAPPTAITAALGPDGHPARGGFLPPVPLPRRMWAGGTLRFADRLRVGDEVERRSRIADVVVKEGRAGPLCFVAVDHEIVSPRGLALTERHDIVYRAAAGGGAPPAEPVPLGPPPEDAEWHRDMQAGPVTLFRYSALTFNGHRIHYDRSYAREAESYPGLIVHGPLQATLLLDFAAEIGGAAPRHFTFRGLSPLFDFMPFRLVARRTGTGLALRTETGTGTSTMEASADW